ncbi:MAG: lamin tail domain-containing protein [Acidobacteriota bacterium]
MLLRSVLLLLTLAPTLAAQVVISQIYGGGGNTGATLRHDFIELFNRGAQPQPLTGWAVQYAGATATTYQSTPLSGTLEPGRYYLIQQAAGAGGPQNLPEPDATGTLALSATAGKVVLRNAAGEVVDRVGYGAAATEFETAPTRDLSNTTAALRARAGCQDTNNNSADFTIAAPAPRHRTTPPVNCAAPPETLRLSISEIQGPGAESPFAGRRALTSGIVTFRRSNGFYLQSPQPDPYASSGILVFTQVTPPAAAQPGALLEVEGDIVEFRPAADPASPPLTELINPAVTLRAQGQSLPAPVTLEPDTDLERYEGMLVRAGLHVVAPLNGSVAWATLDAPRPFRRSHQSPWPNLLRLITTTALPAGVALPNVNGPLDYGSRAYTVYANPIAAPAPLPDPSPAPARAEYEFTIATLNLQRFFNEPALTARLPRLRQYVQRQLGLPDVIVIQEVDNLATLERAADSLGADYMAFTAPSNDPSGITSGFLARASRVAVDAVAQLAKDEEFAPGQVTHDRPPILLRARIAGQPLAVLGVHMRSRLNLEDPRVQAKRAAQFASVAAELRQLPANLPIVVAGDWNSFSSEINFPGFTNLTTTHPAADPYSYVFDGQTQTLDHILLNQPTLLSRVYFARGNADSPAATRLSDHDGVVAYLLSRPVPFTAAGLVNSASFLSGPLAPSTLITLFARQDLPPNARLRLGDARLEPLFTSPRQLVALTPSTLPAGSVTVAVEADGAILHSVEMPTGPVTPALPLLPPTPDQTSYRLRAGAVAELLLNGAGGAAPVSARLCGLPAEVRAAQPRGNLLSVELTVPAACPPGRQRIEISVGSRTTQADLFTEIAPPLQ